MFNQNKITNQIKKYIIGTEKNCRFVETVSALKYTTAAKRSQSIIQMIGSKQRQSTESTECRLKCSTA